jgi:hypothetical protein
MYRRVIPRDLFNEAKLLKCIGKMSVLIHDERIPNLNITHENESKGFIIAQDHDGSIYVDNVFFFDNNGTPVYFHTPLNSKENWPLIMLYKEEEYFPFNDNGEYTLKKDLFQ